MKSLNELLTALLADASRNCSVETERDLAYARSRSEHEGESFFTLTLPKFAEDFERSLDEGRICPTAFAGWRKTGPIPKFLMGLVGLVFDAQGDLRHDASVEAVFHVRQITRFFKKLRVPCSDARVIKAYEKFLDLEAAFTDDCTSHIGTDRMLHFSSVCDVLWTTVFGSGVEFNPLDLVPRHGPGATAERISGNAKYTHQVWHTRLEEVFPSGDYLYTSINHLMDENGLETTTFHEPDHETPVRVIDVPKTLKAPRIIAIEPVCMQYAQQAVSSFLVRAIESSKYTRGSVRFSDQSVNQKMALSASRTLSHATIDLSDASDRVRLELVQVMLRKCPAILEAILACRSTRASVPDPSKKLKENLVINLKKFASMGSALCFPIESMYFFSIIVHSVLWDQGGASPPTLRAILQTARRHYVYGDDIIVPTNETDSVIRGLTLFGCKVNTSKSFCGISFRESCGMDAFRGTDVTPVYLRECMPDNKRATAGLLSWVATSNQLHLKGCWQTAHHMKTVVESVLGKLPVLRDTSPGLGWISTLGLPPPKVYCIKTHRPIVFTYKVKTVMEEDNLDGYPALLKYFLRTRKGDALSSRVDKNHLLFSVRRCAVSRKRTWVPVS